MALIKCPECGGNVSEFASACIHCGCPMDKIKELNNHKKDKVSKTSFKDNLSQTNLNIIKYFETKLAKIFDPFYLGNGSSTLLMGEGKTTKNVVICYFNIDKNDNLFLTWYKGYYDHSDTYSSIVSLHNYKEVLFYVIESYNNKNKEPFSSTSFTESSTNVIDEQSDNNVNSINEKTIVYGDNSFVNLLTDYLSGKKAIPSKDEEILFNKVKKYILDSIGDFSVLRSSYISAKRSGRHFAFPVFYGNNISLFSQSFEQSNLIYTYYKVNSLVDLIRHYELIFNEKIIDNLDKFIKETYTLIQRSDLNLSKCTSLTSNISLVPDSAVDDLIISFK